MKLLNPKRIISVLSIVLLFVVAIPTISTKADDEFANIELNPNISIAQRLLDENKVVYDLQVEDANQKVDASIDESVEIQDRISDIIEDEKEIEIETQETTMVTAAEPTKTFIGSYELTAYIATGNPCASGVYPTVNHTVACNSLALGTRIYIEGLGEFVVEDTGGMANNVIDVFVSDYSTAINFGRQVANVYVLN